jgi:hypothetical protein
MAGDAILGEYGLHIARKIDLLSQRLRGDYED